MGGEKDSTPEAASDVTAPGQKMIHYFPLVDATLNAASALLLVCGFYFIRSKNIPAHRACMLSAFGTSSFSSSAT